MFLLIINLAEQAHFPLYSLDKTLTFIFFFEGKWSAGQCMYCLQVFYCRDVQTGVNAASLLPPTWRPLLPKGELRK